MAVDNVGIDVRIKFGDSRLNGFRDNRGADFVSNEAYPNGAKRLKIIILPKISLLFCERWLAVKKSYKFMYVTSEMFYLPLISLFCAHGQRLHFPM